MASAALSFTKPVTVAGTSVGTSTLDTEESGAAGVPGDEGAADAAGVPAVVGQRDVPLALPPGGLNGSDRWALVALSAATFPSLARQPLQLHPF